VATVVADVRRLPRLGAFDLVIHGAASSSATYGLDDGDPREMARTIVDGTLAVLDAAASSSARVLFLSSGAVYGPLRAPVAETATGGPDPMDPRSAYAEAKRLAETMFAAATESGDVEAVVARLFAFIGPRIPLDAHFAAGNFLRDALAGRPVEVHGDGQPRRSYLYAGDLPEWCWALLARGRPGAAYNVGSPEAVTIAELARRVAAAGGVGVHIARSPCPDDVPWYVPDTARARIELGLEPRTDLDSSIRRTLAWLADSRVR